MIPTNPQSSLSVFNNTPLDLFRDEGDLNRFLKELNLVYRVTDVFPKDLFQIQLSPKERIEAEKSKETGAYIFDKMETEGVNTAFSLIWLHRKAVPENAIFVRVNDLLGKLKGFIITTSAFIKLYEPSRKVSVIHAGTQLNDSVVKKTALSRYKTEFDPKMMKYMYRLMEGMHCGTLAEDAEFNEGRRATRGCFCSTNESIVSLKKVTEE